MKQYRFPVPALLFFVLMWFFPFYSCKKEKDTQTATCNNTAHAGFTSISSDACGDGTVAGLLDGTLLEFRQNVTTDSIWFLQSVNAISATQAIGINVMLNIPGAGATFNFWGNTNKEAYHRLVTVWVTGTAPSAYTGTIGIADAAGVAAGNYASLFSNNIRIVVNTSDKTILLGMKRKDLIPDAIFPTASITVKIASAVGSNQAWNDDVMPGTSSGITLNRTVVPANFPVLAATNTVSDITQNSARCGGNVTSDGGSGITARGLCWSTTANPDITQSKVESGTGTGTFEATLTGLTANTQYHVRAFATNANGTGYGDEAVFTTTGGGSGVPPVVQTLAVDSISPLKATLHASLVSAGTETIVGRGFYYSTTVNPGAGNGTELHIPLTGAFRKATFNTFNQAGTVYHVRAYVTTVQFGNTYGEDVAFKTPSTAPTLNTKQTASAGNGFSFTTEYDILTEGGSPIVDRGVAYCKTSTCQQPNDDMPRSHDGPGGAGTYTTTATGLTQFTQYYYWAYAKTQEGYTYYGNKKEASSGSSTLPEVTTKVITNIAGSGATGGGNIVNTGNSTITAKGICWSNSPNPTLANSKTNDIASGSGTGTYNSALSGLMQNTTYFVRAYATNASGTGYGPEVSFNSPYSLSIGQAFGGGKVAYLVKYGEPGYVAGQAHGIVISGTDGVSGQFITTTSGNPTSMPTTSETYGQGQSNTTALLNYVAGSSGLAIASVTACNNLSEGGQSDWFLPSAGEMAKATINQSSLGLTAEWYWTSTNSGGGGSSIGACGLTLGGGWYQWKPYTMSATYRCVRKF